MATYYSACRQFGTDLGNCPARQMGDKCINCRNLVWVLRQKPTEQSQNTGTEETSQQEK